MLNTRPNGTEIPVITRAPEPARPDDVERITALLAAAAPETVALSEREVRARIDHFTVLRSRDGEVIAVARLQPVDAERAEVRSVVVDGAWRGRGLGRRLVAELVSKAADGVEQLLCFTFRPDFFRGLGFETVADSELPVRSGRPNLFRGRRRLAMSFSTGKGQVS